MKKHKIPSGDTVSNTGKSKEKAPWDENIRTIVFAVILALTFRSFAFEPFHIPSSSMKDTLLIGDYIFVSKYSYGYSRYSFPMGLPLFDGRTGSSRPERGDVAVFRLPSNPNMDFIKRVVGLPNDKIQVSGGVLHINGLPVDLQREKDFTDRLEDGTIAAIRRYTETLPNGKKHRVLDAIQHGVVDDTHVFTVPDGHYFMMGDNRDNSMDSRYTEEVGFVPEENLIGRAEIVFFSVDDRTSIWKIWDWVWALRGDRFFKSIQ
jgi:signal peptidase I